LTDFSGVNLSTIPLSLIVFVCYVKYLKYEMKGGGHLWNHFQAICCVLLCYFPQPSFQDCPINDCGSCGFLPTLSCGCNIIDGKIPIDCCTNNAVFPKFPYTSFANPITTVSIYGTFTTIPDDAYYLLISMNYAFVCLQQFSKIATNLTTYEDTFVTVNQDGIQALQFFYYNPTNLSIMSNNRYITSLTIQKADLATIPYDSIYHFPALDYLDLSNNKLTNVPSNSFNVSTRSTVTIDVSFNQITKLATNAFQLTSLDNEITLNAKNNSLASLDYDAFNLTSTYYISIDVSNNKITKVDEEFSKLIQASEYFQLNLSNNPLPCDSTVQWMSTFVICPPVAIILAGTELCPNGESLYDYLVPYAKCG